MLEWTGQPEILVGIKFAVGSQIDIVELLVDLVVVHYRIAIIMQVRKFGF